MGWFKQLLCSHSHKRGVEIAPVGPKTIMYPARPAAMLWRCQECGKWTIEDKGKPHETS